MYYYKLIDSNGNAMQIGSLNFASSFGVEITEEEYNELLAEFHVRTELLEEYFNKIKSGEMTIDEIENEEDKAEIQRRIDAEPQNDYGIDDTTYNNIIDDYTASLTEEVSQNGYN